VTPWARRAVYFIPGREPISIGLAPRRSAWIELAIEEANWRTATREPRRYNFHATSNAPFYLVWRHAEAGLSSPRRLRMRLMLARSFSRPCDFFKQQGNIELERPTGIRACVASTDLAHARQR
jgi:hypothetical protein